MMVLQQVHCTIVKKNYALLHSKYIALLSKILMFVIISLSTYMINVHLNFSIAFFKSDHFLLKTFMFLQLLKHHQLPITITLFKFKEAKTDFRNQNFKKFKQGQIHNAPISSPTSNMIRGSPENCT